jgi:hypothetical protein
MGNSWLCLNRLENALAIGKCLGNRDRIPDHGSTSPRFASTQRNHGPRQASTDFDPPIAAIMLQSWPRFPVCNREVRGAGLARPEPDLEKVQDLINRAWKRFHAHYLAKNEGPHAHGVRSQGLFSRYRGE